MEKKILLPTVNKLKEFSETAIRTAFDITAKQGKYIVDGKSVMGMFSLDLTSPVTIEYDSEDDAAVEKFEQAIAEIVTEE